MAQFVATRKLLLQRVVRGDDELILKEPISIDIDYKNDNWVLENHDLGIIVIDKDYDVCLRSFQEEFFFIWEEYGKTDDSQLTVGAHELKQRLHSLVHDGLCPPHPISS